MTGSGTPHSLKLVEYDHDISAPLLCLDVTGALENTPGRRPKSPHRHSYHELIWIRAESAQHLFDGEIAEFSGRTLIVIPKGRIHCFTPSARCRGCAVRFEDGFLARLPQLLFTQYAGQIALKLDNRQSETIETYLAMIRDESACPSSYGLQTLQHLLAALLSKLEEVCIDHAQILCRNFSEKQRIWNRFNSLVERKFKAEHGASFYANELGVSPHKLGEVVKLYSGRNVSCVIDLRLISEAKRLILFSALSVKEIAFELGFKDHSYFSRVFKRVTGMPPSAFRTGACP